MKIKLFISALMFFLSFNISLAEKNSSNTVVPSNANNKILPYPIAIMADAPFVKKADILQKQQQEKNRLKLKHNKSDLEKSNNGKQKKITNKPKIIKLEVSENEAKRVNSSKSFVFSDRTNRVDKSVVDRQKQNIRIQQIDVLRRSMARK